MSRLGHPTTRLHLVWDDNWKIYKHILYETSCPLRRKEQSYCIRLLKYPKFPSEIVYWFLYFFSLKQLKKDVRESERKVEELLDLRREEQVNTVGFLHLDVPTVKPRVMQRAFWKHLSVMDFTGEHKERTPHEQGCGGGSRSPAGPAAQQGIPKQPSDCAAAGTFTSLLAKCFNEKKSEQCLSISYCFVPLPPPQVAERTLVEQRMEIGDLRGSIASSTEKAAQEKESLKKATRAQKQRAERFEAAIEKVYEQLKEKVRSLFLGFFPVHSFIFSGSRSDFISSVAIRMLSWPGPG